MNKEVLNGPGFIVTNNSGLYPDHHARVDIGYTTAVNFLLKDNQIFFTHGSENDNEKQQASQDANAAANKLRGDTIAAGKKATEEWFKQWKIEQGYHKLNTQTPKKKTPQLKPKVAAKKKQGKR